MDNTAFQKEFQLLCVIVNFGMGSKILKAAKENGITGGTVFLGKGTIKNKILEFLDLNDVKKEIVIMISDNDIVLKALDALDKKFSFSKPNHGIAFTTSVSGLVGINKYKYSKIKENRGVNPHMYKSIFIIVDKGKSENVIDIANKSGAKGATVINARGSGIHETNKLFAMAIEPEKDIIMILSEEKVTESIVSSVRENLKIDEPGNGIIFTLDVDNAYGLY